MHKHVRFIIQMCILHLRNARKFTEAVSPQNCQPGWRRASAHPTQGDSKMDDTVDGWNPANQLRLVVYPIIYKVLAPSQVVVWDFFHQQYLGFLL